MYEVFELRKYYKSKKKICEKNLISRKLRFETVQEFVREQAAKT